jgi:hypothetical protein
MKNCLKLISTLVLSASTLAVLGCSDTVDEISNSIDCHQVCQRYADCFKSDYDVDGCTDKCENSADNDEDRERKLEACNSCIDDRSCTDATFNCADDCIGIVP